MPDDDSNYLGQGDLGAKMMGKLPVMAVSIRKTNEHDDKPDKLPNLRVLCLGRSQLE